MMDSECVRGLVLVFFQDWSDGYNGIIGMLTSLVPVFGELFHFNGDMC